MIHPSGCHPLVYTKGRPFRTDLFLRSVREDKQLVLFPSEDQIHDPQDDHGSYKGDDQAGQVQPGHAAASKETEDPAAHEGADNACNDIHDAAHLIITFHDDAWQASRRYRRV